MWSRCCSVAREEEKKPRPEGELEEMWDEFTKRAGFVHQKKRTKARRLWMLAILLAVASLSGFLTRGRIQSAYRDWRDYAPVTARTDWVRLRSHIEVRLEPGARMRATKELVRGSQRVKLEGTAHFRVQLTDTTNLSPATTPVVLLTRSGDVVSGYGEFTVSVRGDTTDIEEIPPARPRYIGFMPFPSLTMVRAGDHADPVRIQSGERVRLVRNQPLQRMP
jgi:hypothetical protein